MYNKILYSLFIGLTLLFVSSYAAIFNRDEVKECTKSLKTCKIPQIVEAAEKSPNIDIYCKDKVCSSIEYEDFTAKFPGNETLITRLCNKEKIASVVDEHSENYSYSINCSSMFCKADSECLTNKCFKDVCVDNDEVDIEICQFIYHYHFFTISSSYDFTCGKLIGYSCKSNSECASNHCFDGECYQPKDTDSTMESLGSYLFYGGVLILLFVTFIVVGCLYCCCFKKRRKNKNKA